MGLKVQKKYSREVFQRSIPEKYSREVFQRGIPERYFLEERLMKGGDGVIAGIGTDIVEISRVAKACERYGDTFLVRILSNGELVLAKSYATSRRDEFAAGRFALKEAMAKASGFGLARLGMSSVDIRTTDKGLEVHFTTPDHPLGAQGVIWHLSISHTNDIAFAVAVLERS